MSEETSIHGGVVYVTDAHVMANSRYNRIKATNPRRDLSVHFTTEGIGEGISAPGPREALLVHIISGIQPKLLLKPEAGEEPVDIHFRAISAEACTDRLYDVGAERPAIKSTVARSDEDSSLSDMLHMSTIERGRMTRLQLTMTNESSRIMHAGVVMSKGQVEQMIVSLMLLYPRLHED